MKVILRNLFLLVVFFLTGTISGQEYPHVVSTNVDTVAIKIGAQINLSLKVKVDTTASVIFPESKNFGALEVLESYPIDTIIQSQNVELIKRYGITQFDSGSYTIPRLPVLIDQKPIFSDSIEVEVHPVVVDTLKQKMYDIRGIVAVKSHFDYSWLWYLILLPGIIAIYFLLRAFKPKEIVEEEVFTTPIEKATTLLTRLEEKELWQQGDVKLYYSELTEIVRIYIEDALEVPAMESTSSEVINSLKKEFRTQKLKVTRETLASLDKVLKNADLVKFAKSKPIESDIESDREITENVISSIDKAIPEEVVEEESIDEIVEKEAKLILTKRRLIIGAVSTIVLVYVGLGMLFYTDSFDDFSRLFGAKSSQAVLDSEWATSSYGYPSIKIESPTILQRQITDSTIKKIKKQTFISGTALDEHSIIVTTHPVSKDTTAVDLSVVSEKVYVYLESIGGQNIIINEDDFEINDAIKGKKSFGSLSLPVTSEENSEYKRVRYEMLLFGQENALQQVLVLYDDNNEYAEEVKERIINSIEIEKTTE